MRCWLDTMGVMVTVADLKHLRFSARRLHRPRRVGLFGKSHRCSHRRRSGEHASAMGTAYNSGLDFAASVQPKTAPESASPEK